MSYRHKRSKWLDSRSVTRRRSVEHTASRAPVGGHFLRLRLFPRKLKCFRFGAVAYRLRKCLEKCWDIDLDWSLYPQKKVNLCYLCLRYTCTTSTLSIYMYSCTNIAWPNPNCSGVHCFSIYTAKTNALYIYFYRVVNRWEGH